MLIVLAFRYVILKKLGANPQCLFLIILMRSVVVALKIRKSHVFLKKEKNNNGRCFFFFATIITDREANENCASVKLVLLWIICWQNDKKKKSELMLEGRKHIYLSNYFFY